MSKNAQQNKKKATKSRRKTQAKAGPKSVAKSGKSKAVKATKTPSKAKKPKAKTAGKQTPKPVNINAMEIVMSKNTNQFKQFEQIAQDATDFSREGFEAFQKSMTILTQRSEEIWKTAMGIAQSSAEKQQKLLKDAMGSKTLNEWADVQNKIAQSQFDDFVNVATKISELGVKALTDSAEPINEQISKTVTKVSQSKAA